MGGALAGEVASGLAVSTLATELGRRTAEDGAEKPPPAERLGQLLVESVEAANTCILGEGESNPQRRGMGTTLTAVWIHSAAGEIAQVGDSRAYLFQGGHLKQLTKDQSLVGKLLEDRIITEEEAERLPHKNIILQALGSEEPLEVAHQVHRLKPGDLLLLCTDGLSGVVNNRELEDELRRGGTPRALCERLIASAEKKGGPDNITVLLVKAEGR
jgi:protein phosphatase